MIIRHIPMKKARLSSFSCLVKYIIDEQDKQERVGKVKISNCNSIEPTWAIQEVLATQAQNQRATADKTYHLLISFAPGESPSDEILEAIEHKVVASIGLSDHQRISSIHHDTDNLHIHIAINKIHPNTYKMIEPFRAYKTFSDVASKLETEYGLVVTNHHIRKGRSENLADDMEQHSGIESLINWMKRNCKQKIETAESWDDIHKVLSEHGLTIRIRANGFVFCDSKGLMVKASSISREFSKKRLEEKLGDFKSSEFNERPPTSNIYRYEPLDKKVIGSEIYARYKEDQQYCGSILAEKLKQLREVKADQIEKSKQRGKTKRSALKLLRISSYQKKYLYKQIYKSLLKDLEAIHQNYTKQRIQLIDLHKRKTWADWLRQKAHEGDVDALMALRYRNRKNKNTSSLSGELSTLALKDIEKLDSITKEGTKIYSLDKTVIRDTGNEISITKGASITALKSAIEMAKQQYGNFIQVNGSPLFKKLILQITVQNNISVKFADPDMESLRTKMLTQQETQHDQARRYEHKIRSRFSTSVKTTRDKHQSSAEHSGKLINTKPNAISIGRTPLAQSQNSLRNLPQLDVVQFARRSEVLLQDHAHDKLERKGRKSDHYV